MSLPGLGAWVCFSLMCRCFDFFFLTSLHLCYILLTLLAIHLRMCKQVSWISAFCAFLCHVSLHKTGRRLDWLKNCWLSQQTGNPDWPNCLRLWTDEIFSGYTVRNIYACILTYIIYIRQVGCRCRFVNIFWPHPGVCDSEAFLLAFTTNFLALIKSEGTLIVPSRFGYRSMHLLVADVDYWNRLCAYVVRLCMTYVSIWSDTSTASFCARYTGCAKWTSCPRKSNSRTSSHTTSAKCSARIRCVQDSSVLT